MSGARWRAWTPQGQRALLQAALGCAARGWEITAGMPMVGNACGCGQADCAAPGAHPQEGALAAATSDASLIRWNWTLRPDAPIVLPTGRRFDAVEVPVAVGARALSRLRLRGLPVGPVTASRDRYHFFVAPEEPADFRRRTDLLAIPDLDVTHHGAGSWVLVPPARPSGGEPRWAHHPDEVAGPVPGGTALLGTLAYAAMRELLRCPAPRTSPETVGAST